MTSSQTTLFDPSIGDLVIAAYGRCQIKRTALTPEHMVDARLEANLLLSEWDNIQPHLWAIDLYSLPLVQGTSNYVLPATTIGVLDVYISTTVSGVVNDRITMPVARSDYASYPDKAQQGFPTVYWFNRLIVPEINWYQTPDGNGPYTAKIYRVHQNADANPAGAQTLDAPRRFVPAFVSGLAARLAETYAPQLYTDLEERYQRRFAPAVIQDQENAPFQLAPNLGSYFR